MLKKDDKKRLAGLISSGGPDAAFILWLLEERHSSKESWFPHPDTAPHELAEIGFQLPPDSGDRIRASGQFVECLRSVVGRSIYPRQGGVSFFVRPVELLGIGLLVKAVRAAHPEIYDDFLFKILSDQLKKHYENDGSLAKATACYLMTITILGVEASLIQSVAANLSGKADGILWMAASIQKFSTLKELTLLNFSDDVLTALSRNEIHPIADDDLPAYAIVMRDVFKQRIWSSIAEQDADERRRLNRQITFLKWSAACLGTALVLMSYILVLILFRNDTRQYIWKLATAFLPFFIALPFGFALGLSKVFGIVTAVLGFITACISIYFWLN